MKNEKTNKLVLFWFIFYSSVLGRLLASYKHRYKHPNQYVLEQTLNIAGKPKKINVGINI